MEYARKEGPCPYLVRAEGGPPQQCGGPTRLISPLLMNVALHGLEEAAGVRYRETGVNAGTTVPGTPILVTYATLLSMK